MLRVVFDEPKVAHDKLPWQHSLMVAYRLKINKHEDLLAHARDKDVARWVYLTYPQMSVRMSLWRRVRRRAAGPVEYEGTYFSF
jgi:hypothetical protein